MVGVVGVARSCDRAPSRMTGQTHFWSERRELNSGYTHPKGAYCRYTTLRKFWYRGQGRVSSLRFCCGFHAFGARFYTAAARQRHPLEIWFLVAFYRGIILSAKFHEPPRPIFRFSANSALLSHERSIANSSHFASVVLFLKLWIL